MNHLILLPPSTPVAKGNYVEVVDILKESCLRLSDHTKQSNNKQVSTGNILNKNKEQLPQSENVNYSNFEDILEALGGFGNYQLFILFLLLTLEIPTAFVTFIPIFVGRVPQIWICGNETVPVDEVCGCKNPVPFAQDVEESIVAQWGLICDKEWVFDFVTSIQMLGMFFGSVIGSQFADWYGRRYGFLGATLLLGMGTMISSIAWNPYVYAVARFLSGAGVTSFMNVTLVGVVEVMPPKWRSFSNCIGPTGEGIMILSILAHYIRPWRTLYLATLVPFALIVVIYPFVPESSRWLMKQGRTDEAAAILQRVAQMNGRCNVVISSSTLRRIIDKERAQCSEAPEKRWTYLDFIKDPKLRVTSAYNMAMWFAWSLTYYGISFNIKNVGGDIYTNVFLMGCVNAVGQRSALLLNNRIGRRKTLFTSMTFCAVFLVVLAVIIVLLDHSNVPHLVILTFCLLAQFGMATARSTARLISGESFPTAVRTMGMGIGGITANIAGILTPQLAYFGGRWPSLPFFTFAFVSVGGSLISFWMTETMGRPLDDGDTATTKKECSSSLQGVIISKTSEMRQHCFLENNGVILVSIKGLLEGQDHGNNKLGEKNSTGIDYLRLVPNTAGDIKRSPLCNTRTF